MTASQLTTEDSPQVVALPPQPTAEGSALFIDLPSGPTNNRSQDAYEELRELLRGIEVFPTEMRVDWNTEGREAPILLGHLSLVDVLRIIRTLKKGMEPRA